MRRIIIILLFISFGFTVYGQGFNSLVKGQIVDAKGNPVAYATITVLTADSAKILGGDLTDEKGQFSIKLMYKNNINLKISAISFINKTQSDIALTENTNMGKITLIGVEKELKGVTVTATKAAIQLSAEKKVFDVESNLTSTGGAATDVLQSVPSLSVDGDGNVSMRGKGNVTLLIDGKPATLFGGDAAAALQSLPAGSIQSVEVISNPSAQFDAQGLSGIVNLVTKKDNRVGFNGTVTIGAGTLDKYNAGINLNLRKKKWNFFLNSNIKANPTYTHTSTTQHNNLDSFGNHNDFYTYENNQRTQGSWFSSIGADYTFDKNNSFTLTENWNMMKYDSHQNSLFQHYANDTIQTFQNRYNNVRPRPNTLSSTLEFKHKFKNPLQTLNTSINFSKTWMKRANFINSNYYNSDNTLDYGQVNEALLGVGNNRSLNFQSDFSTPFLTQNGKLNLGIKSQDLWFRTNSNNPTKDLNGNNIQLDTAMKVDFNYQQQTQAAYTSFSDLLGKWSYQIGLRAEYAHYKGTYSYYNYADTFHTDYIDYNKLSLFPSAFLSYKLSSKQSINLNYARRINRPDFRQLMPFRDLSNPQEISSGTPSLKPEYINSFELSTLYQPNKKTSILGSIYTQLTNDMIDKVRLTNPSTGISITQPLNYKNSTTFGAELTAKIQINKIWDAMLNGNVFYNQINFSNLVGTVSGNTANTGLGYFLKGNTTVKLPTNFSIQLNGNYESSKVAGQGKLSSSYWFDIAVKESFWKNNRAALALTVNDFLNTHKYTNKYIFNTYTQTIFRDKETRIANLSFTYRFGNIDPKPKRIKETENIVPLKDRSVKEEEGGF